MISNILWLVYYRYHTHFGLFSCQTVCSWVRLMVTIETERVGEKTSNPIIDLCALTTQLTYKFVTFGHQLGTS